MKLKRQISLIWVFLLTYTMFFFSQASDDLIEIEHLWLTQDVHVAADRLCQDGQYLFFNSLNDCERVQTPLNCSESLKITAISYIEKVDLPNGEYVTRFFSVKTSYDFLRYELVDDGPIKTYELVESKQIELPTCEGMTKKAAKKIRRARPAAPQEVSFMQGLLDSGVPVVNSPYGKFHTDKIEPLEVKLTNQSLPKLKSPLCNKKLNYDNIITQASGEWTGNGLVQLNVLSDWQKNSLELYIQKAVNEDNKETYEFVCASGEVDV